MPLSLYEELNRKVKGTKLRDGEDYEDYAKRVAGEINKISDVAWKELSSPLQKWANSVLETIEENRGKKDADLEALPALAGFPEPEASGSDDDTNSSDESGDNEADGEAGEESIEDDEANADGDDKSADEGGDPDPEASDTAEANDAPDTPDESEEATGETTEATDDNEHEEDVPKRASGRRKDKKKVDKAVAQSKPKGKAKTVTTAIAKKSAAGRPRQGHGTDKIKILAKQNPHREGTKLYGYFKKYKDGMTVDQAIKAGIPPRNIAYLESLKVIKVQRAA